MQVLSLVHARDEPLILLRPQERTVHVHVEHDKREDGTWDESAQTVVDTICPYCGVGCELELRVQDNEIVKVTSPWDNDVTNGHLCIKGRFGFGVRPVAQG